MKPPVKIAAFLAGLGLLLGVGWAAGAVTGPVGPTAEEHGHGPMTGKEHASDHGNDHGSEDSMSGNHDGGADLPGGLAIARDGYRLDLAESAFAAGRPTIAYKVLDAHGEPVTAYRIEHTKQMHLIVVNRDFSGFQHVHPVLDTATGTWSTPVQLSAGAWRIFADFVPEDGPALTLGADVSVPGPTSAAPVERVTRTDTVDGLTVTVSGDLAGGTHSMLTMTVTRNGVPVRELQPYLGAFGHLVALRAGDLAYLHVHPSEDAAEGRLSGPSVEFGAKVPSAGRYHLYLDFQVGGVVRTAHFVLDAK